MTMNIHGGNVSFENTIVGDNATMTVHQIESVERDFDALLAAVEQHRAELPEQVVRDAEEARAALSAPEPQRARFAAAMERIRDGASSIVAVAGAAAAVLRTLGMV